MVKYILIAEVHNLQIPCSLEIKFNQSVFFLYTINVNQRINSLKSKLLDIDNYFKTYREDPIKISQVIIKDNKSSVSIITEIQEIDDSIEKKSFNELTNYFSILIKAFNLFYTTLFNIERISIFKKKDTILILTRIIENYPEGEIISEIGNELIENKYVRYFEPFYPNILENLSKNQKYIDIFDEFVLAKIEERLEYKIVYLWNTLEHISERFLKIKKKHRLILPEKFEELKNLIENKLEELLPTDLIFSETKEMAKEVILEKIDNYPKIIEKVLYLLKNNNLFSSDNEEMIKNIYYLRNQIFHYGIYLPKLLSKFVNKFPEKKDYTIGDLKNIIKDFENLINNILVNIFGIDNLFEVNENNKLSWKKQYPQDKSIFTIDLTMRNGRKMEQIHDMVHSGFKSKSELEFYIKGSIINLSRKGKYLNLLRFLAKIINNWKKKLTSDYLKSYVDDSEEEFLIKFKDDKTGNYIISTNSNFIKNLRNSLKSKKKTRIILLTSYYHIVNIGTIKFNIQLITIVDSLAHLKETKGNFYCHQLEFRGSTSKTSKTNSRINGK